VSDPSLVLQAALVAALKGSAAVQAVVGARVYDHPPQSPAFPYVSVGDDQVVDDSTACEDAFECFSTVHLWSRAKGKPELKRLGAAVRAALDVDLTLTGFRLVTHEHRDTRYFRDADGVTEHGVASFRYLVDPA